MRPLLLLICALGLAARPASAQDAPRPKARASLADKVERFLHRVRSAPRAAAVAAVRGGRSFEQAASLEKNLAARAAPLRSSLLTDAPPAGAEAAARGLYRALAVSFLVRSAEADGGPDAADRARPALRELSAALKSDGAPPLVLAALSGEVLGSQDLLDAGWDAYAAGLGAGVRVRRTVRTAQKPPKPAAAALEEKLQSVLGSCADRKLGPAELGEGLFLAGLLYQSLAAADLGPDAASQDEAEAALPPPSGEDEAQSPEPRPEVPFVPKSIYAKASPSVVFILCAGPEGAGELGSGSVIDARGRVLTNAHVVVRDSTRKPWDSIQVYFKPPRMTGDPDQDLKSPVPAKVVAHSRALDLALLELQTPPAGLAPLPLGRPSDVSIGDRVAAIGHPEQGGLWTLTTGIVSTVVADLGGVKGKKAFQTDASINRGNSGGPLLNAAGEFIGVNTAMSRTAADGLAITSVNFAVDSGVAKRWLARSGVKLAYAAPPPAAPAAALAAPMEAVRELSRDRKESPALQEASFDQSKGASDAFEAAGFGAAQSAPAAAAPPRLMESEGLGGGAAGGLAAPPVAARGRAAAKREAASGPASRETVTEGRPYSIERFLSSKRKGVR